MTSAEHPAPDDPGAWIDADTREWRMDRGFPDRTRGALAWLGRTRPELVRPTAALLLAAVVIAIGAAALGYPTVAWSAVGLGVLVALGIGASQTTTPRDFDAYAGSTHRLRFTPTSVVLLLPGSTLELDYAGITGVRLRGDVVELRTAVPDVAPVLPAPLLGPGGIVRLRAAVEAGSDAAAAPAPPYPITHPLEGLPSAHPVGSTAPGGRGPGSAALRTARAFLTSPAPIVIVVVIVVLLALQAVTGSRLLGEWALPYLIFLGIAIAASAGIAALTARRWQQRGLVSSAQLQSDRLATRTGPVARTVELGYISDVQVGAEAVLVKTRPLGQWRVLPRELLTPEAQRDLLLRVSGRSA